MYTVHNSCVKAARRDMMIWLQGPIMRRRWRGKSIINGIEEARDERREARNERREARSERRETRNERREARDETERREKREQLINTSITLIPCISENKI
jgi:hypothetical protein